MLPGEMCERKRGVNAGAGSLAAYVDMDEEERERAKSLNKYSITLNPQGALHRVSP